jgi:Zn finger protein HypA/HybF involved in hydrogenase expression
MTDRERLLKILNVPIYPHENVDPLEAVADYLLDNGVTFHKWIPVSLGFLPDVESLNILPKVTGAWEEWWPGDCALIMTGEEKLYRCSICDAKYPDVEGFNFCPHCGNPIESKSIKVKIPYTDIRSYGERDGDG